MGKLIVIGALVLLSACGEDSDDASVSPTTASESVTSGTVDDVLKAPEPLPALVTVPVDDLGTNHINPPVSFGQSPSIGGDHYGFWQNCGFYNVELLEGAATHTLEHGAVWITYNAAAMSSGDLAELESLAANNEKLLISPYEHDDFIILSAWGVQQRGVAGPTTSEGMAEIEAFTDAWQDNPELAEAGVRCDGAAGIPPNDIRTLADGAQVPAEFG